MISLFMNRPLWQKLMILFLLVGTVPLVLVSYQSTSITQDALDKQTQYLLSGVRDTKSKSIQQYFENRKMDESTQHNAALVEEASAAAKSMAAQASSMRNAVEFFRSN